MILKVLEMLQICILTRLLLCGQRKNTYGSMDALYYDSYNYTHESFKLVMNSYIYLLTLF